MSDSEKNNPSIGNQSFRDRLGCALLGLPIVVGVINAFRELVTSFQPGMGYTGQQEAGLSMAGGVVGSALLLGLGILLGRRRH